MVWKTSILNWKLLSIMSELVKCLEALKALLEDLVLISLIQLRAKRYVSQNYYSNTHSNKMLAQENIEVSKFKANYIKTSKFNYRHIEISPWHVIIAVLHVIPVICTY